MEAKGGIVSGLLTLTGQDSIKKKKKNGNANLAIPTYAKGIYTQLLHAVIGGSAEGQPFLGHQESKVKPTSAINLGVKKMLLLHTMMCLHNVPEKDTPE